jgi:hypothetical protein
MQKHGPRRHAIIMGAAIFFALLCLLASQVEIREMLN